MKTKPSDFMSFPSCSEEQNYESEMIAYNIMVILKRTGNTFRDLTWEEYKTERLKDKDFSEKEKPIFNKIIKYCKTADTAKKFSPHWK
jgi:hypothetical protein